MLTAEYVGDELQLSISGGLARKHRFGRGCEKLVESRLARGRSNCRTHRWLRTEIGDFFQLSIGNVNAKDCGFVEDKVIDVEKLRVGGPRGVVHFCERADATFVGLKIEEN